MIPTRKRFKSPWICISKVENIHYGINSQNCRCSLASSDETTPDVREESTNQTKTNQLKWAYQISVILFISVPDIPNSKPIDTSRCCCSATSAVWCLRPNLKKNFDRCQCFDVECFRLKLSFDMRSFHWHFLIKMPKQWRISCKTSAFARRRMR